jgi:AcrR family transcriptional regulator
MSAGRKRTFDKDQALETAMQVFWCKGFVGTSVSDLTRALGINKPSLYAAFGNKEQLFVSALTRYGRHYGLPHASRLLEPAEAPLRQRLRAYLLSIAGMVTDPALPGGCLIAISSCDAGGSTLPEEAVRTLDGINRETHRMLTEVFSRESEQGLVAGNKDPGALASYVMSLMFGMAVMVRGGFGMEDLTALIDLAVETV